MASYRESIVDDNDWSFSKAGKVAYYLENSDEPVGYSGTLPIRVYDLASGTTEYIQKAFQHYPVLMTYKIISVDREKEIKWGRWKSGKITVDEIPPDYAMCGIKYSWPDLYNLITKNLPDYSIDISEVEHYDSSYNPSPEISSDEWYTGSESESDSDDDI